MSTTTGLTALPSDDGPSDPDGQGENPSERDSRESWVSAAVPLAVSVAVLAVLNPSLWFRDAVPALLDLPGHLLPPVILGQELLPRGSIQGWSFDWFAGFPVYHFYFPLPGLLVAGLRGLLGDALALRTVTALPALLLPWSVWALGRLTGIGRLPTAGMAVVGSTVLLMTSHQILGGNLIALTSGEFSYAWSLLFLVLHLGLLGRSREGPRWIVLSGVALAAAVVSHIVPVIPVVLGAVPFLALRRWRRAIIASWIIAGVLSAFWVVPMALRLDLTASLGWTYIPGRRDLLPAELLLLLPAAGYGFFRLRHHPGLVFLTSAGLAAVVLAVVPQDLVMRARPLPVWHLSVHLLAGAGIGCGAHTLLRHRPHPGRVLGVAALLGCWLFVMAVRGVDSDRWAPVARGLPDRPGAEELDSLVARMNTLPPGRIHWEPGFDELDRWGGKHVLALLPYWTDHTTLSGLWAESAPIAEFLPILDSQLDPHPAVVSVERDTPTLPWSPADAAAGLRWMGVRYLLTHSPETTRALLADHGPPVAESGLLRLFDLGPAPLVTALPCWSSVPADSSLREAARDWFVAHGPGEAPVVQGLPPSDGRLDPVVGCGMEEEVAVPPDRVRLDRNHIAFSAVAVGVPHLIRVSYFPDWTVDGGEGPFPASPWFMVVVPTDREVVLEYRSGLPIQVGLLITALGFVGLLTAGAVARRPRRMPRQRV